MQLINTKCPFHVFVAGAFTTALVSASYKYIRSKWRNSRRISTRIPAELMASSSMYKKELYVAVECAILAGENIKHAIDQSKTVANKGPTDFVTETDKNNEAMIFQTLREKFPSHQFIGEESSADSGGVPPLTSAPTWIVDPVDGTTNFIHTFPFTCVSIGFAVNGEVVVGVVYDPIKDELFTAVKNHGSFCNLVRNKTSSAKKLKSSLVLTEFGYNLKNFSTMSACMSAVVTSGIHAFRSLGSGALDLCYIGCGRIDALYSGVAGEGWCPWDYAAGMLVVSEAGGVLTTVTGQPFNLYGDSVLAAACAPLADELSKITSAFYIEKRS